SVMPARTRVAHATVAVGVGDGVVIALGVGVVVGVGLVTTVCVHAERRSARTRSRRFSEGAPCCALRSPSAFATSSGLSSEPTRPLQSPCSLHIHTGLT